MLGVQLTSGQFLKVPSNLIKRQKQHFHSLPNIGVDVILGNNGYIWISATPSKGNDENRVQGQGAAPADVTEEEKVICATICLFIACDRFSSC